MFFMLLVCNSVYATAADTTPPDIELIPPLRYSNRVTGSLLFEANENAAYRCSLDGSAFTACTSPFTYNGLANGQHTFVIIATDSAGNACAPVTCRWTVNTALAASSETLLPCTGQTKCYDALKGEIACDGSGQDGESQAGVPWPYPRFIDHNNGSITDNLTGLIWLKNADCFGLQSWASALNSVKNLADGQCGLTDGSKAGEWRLPTVNELESLVDLQRTSPPLPSGHPFISVQQEDYWSSTTCAGAVTFSWYVYMRDGYVGKHQEKTTEQYVWAVRSAAAVTAIVQLPWSGQTSCFDRDGAAIFCSGTGQDGELKNGVRWPWPRFGDNGDGTQTDKLTGLIWSKDGNPAGKSMLWPGTLDYVATLNARNWLGYADWRLPNRKELMSLVNREQANSALWLASEGFLNIPEDFCCWSSNTFPDSIDYAWYVDLQYGNVSRWDKNGVLSCYVWPVRGGFVKQKLTVTKIGSGVIASQSGSLDWSGNSGTARLDPGSTITLTPRPDSGFKFTSWSGACSGSADCIVTMNASKSVVASFAALPVATAPASLTVLAKNAREGTVALVAAASPAPGAIYNFEYSNNGGVTWAAGYSGKSRTPTISLKTPGTYLFRVFVTADNFAPSVAKSGNRTYVFKPDKGRR